MPDIRAILHKILEPKPQPVSAETEEWAAALGIPVYVTDDEKSLRLRIKKYTSSHQSRA